MNTPTTDLIAQSVPRLLLMKSASLKLQKACQTELFASKLRFCHVFRRTIVYVVTLCSSTPLLRYFPRIESPNVVNLKTEIPNGSPRGGNRTTTSVVMLYTFGIDRWSDRKEGDKSNLEAVISGTT